VVGGCAAAAALAYDPGTLPLRIVYGEAAQFYVGMTPQKNVMCPRQESDLVTRLDVSASLATCDDEDISSIVAHVF
jgi:hypothetical protein